MKFKFSLKDKEVNMEADVEKMVEKSLEYKAARPDRKTRYQIRQEEKRKNAELKYKQDMTMILILFGVFFIVIAFCCIMSMLE